MDRVIPVTIAGVAGGQLEIYREHLICTPKVTEDGNIKEVCLPPEGLARFLSFIGSIPLDKQRLLPRHWDTEGRPRDSKTIPPYTVNHYRYSNSFFQPVIDKCRSIVGIIFYSLQLIWGSP